MAGAKARRTEQWKSEAERKAREKGHRLDEWTEDGKDVLRSTCQNGGCIASAKVTTTRRGGITGDIVDEGTTAWPRPAPQCPLLAGPRHSF